MRPVRDAGDWVIARLIALSAGRRAGRGARSSSASIRSVRWSWRPRRRSRASVCRWSSRPRRCRRPSARADGRCGRGRAARGSARAAAGDDRWRGCEGFRRCGLRRARWRRRLPPAGRDRRCQSLRAARQRARHRGARARHLGLFPDARAADAADGALEPPVLAGAARGSAVHGRRHARHRRAASLRSAVSIRR